MYDHIVKFDWEADLSSADASRRAVLYLEEQLGLGSGKAGFTLQFLLGDGVIIGSPEARAYLVQLKLDRTHILETSFPLLHDQAMAGDGEAMHHLALYYQNGFPPLSQSFISMYHYWVEKARRTDYGRDIGQF
jgi:hypothetical protein